jgi:hypothetical protein
VVLVSSQGGFLILGKTCSKVFLQVFQAVRGSKA